MENGPHQTCPLQVQFDCWSTTKIDCPRNAGCPSKAAYQTCYLITWCGSQAFFHALQELLGCLSHGELEPSCLHGFCCLAKVDGQAKNGSLRPTWSRGRSTGYARGYNELWESKPCEIDRFSGTITNYFEANTNQQVTNEIPFEVVLSSTEAMINPSWSPMSPDFPLGRNPIPDCLLAISCVQMLKVVFLLLFQSPKWAKPQEKYKWGVWNCVYQMIRFF